MISTGSLTGNKPEMTIFDRMGDFSEAGEVSQAFGFMVRFTVNRLPVPSSRYLCKKLPIGDATIRRKKDDATVNQNIE